MSDASRKARLHLGSAICFFLAALVLAATALARLSHGWIQVLLVSLFMLNAALQFLAYRKQARVPA